MEMKIEKKIIVPQNLVPTDKVEPETCAQLEIDLGEEEDIQPIVVTPLDSERFIILDGNNRAYTLAEHRKEIEAIVITKDSDRNLILEMENQLEIPSFPHKEFLTGQKTFHQLVAAAKQAAKETGYSSISDMVGGSKAEDRYNGHEEKLEKENAADPPFRRDLIEEYYRVKSLLNKIPTCHEIEKYGKYPIWFYTSKFGEWERFVNLMEGDA